jgi:hypothetical protein
MSVTAQNGNSMKFSRKGGKMVKLIYKEKKYTDGVRRKNHVEHQLYDHES